MEGSKNKMTHQDVLEIIGSPMPDCACDECRQLNALIAVANRHCWDSKYRGMRIKQRCPECGFAYPCPTIEDIVKVLS